jgi:hypothetical protein
MAEDRDRKPSLTPAGRRSAEARQQRLAMALRDNLRKRKAQQRSRRTALASSPGTVDPTPGGQDGSGDGY